VSVPSYVEGLPNNEQPGGIMSQIFGQKAFSATVISISGYAQVGKDTLAGFLIEQGYKRLAFADSLRDALWVLNPWVPIHGGERYYQLQTVVDLLGWDDAKAHPEIRRLLQVMGTEVGRQILGENVWVDLLKRKIEPEGKYVVTDTRFPNEFKALRDLGAQMVRVTRDGIGPVNGHKSETALDEFIFDVTVENDGTLEELALTAKAMA
jgi:hypothetical protein